MKNANVIIDEKSTLAIQEIDQGFFRWQTEQKIVVRHTLHDGNTTIKVAAGFPLLLPGIKLFNWRFGKRRDIRHPHT